MDNLCLGTTQEHTSRLCGVYGVLCGFGVCGVCGVIGGFGVYGDLCGFGVLGVLGGVCGVLGGFDVVFFVSVVSCVCGVFGGRCRQLPAALAATPGRQALAGRQPHTRGTGLMRLEWREDGTSRDKIKMHTTLPLALSLALSPSLSLSWFM